MQENINHHRGQKPRFVAIELATGGWLRNFTTHQRHQLSSATQHSTAPVIVMAATECVLCDREVRAEQWSESRGIATLRKNMVSSRRSCYSGDEESSKQASSHFN